MKIVFISNIHSSSMALEGLSERDCDYLCIGHLVDYGMERRDLTLNIVQVEKHR